MASKDDIIADLRRIVDAQAKTIERLEKRIADLELQLAKAFKKLLQLLEIAVQRYREAAVKESRSSQEGQAGWSERAQAKAA